MIDVFLKSMPECHFLRILEHLSNRTGVGLDGIQCILPKDWEVEDDVVLTDGVVLKDGYSENIQVITYEKFFEHLKKYANEYVTRYLDDKVEVDKFMAIFQSNEYLSLLHNDYEQKKHITM